MPNFHGKSVFIWQIEAISQNVEAVADQVAAGGFEAAHLHSTSIAGWETSLRTALVNALKNRGIEVYGSAAVYGDSPAGEGLQAAQLVNRYGLAGWIFDAEVGWDEKPNRVANTATLCQTYIANTSMPGAWCYWCFPKLHYLDVLAEAMKYLSVAMPMAYWNSATDNSPAFAVRYLEQSYAQWQPYLQGKIFCPAGRAFNGSGLPGLMTPAQLTAFDTRARELGAAGITWWDMQHTIKLLDVWSALCATPKFSSGGVEPPTGETKMWEQNALIAAFEPIDDKHPAAANIDFAALKASGVHAVLLNCGGTKGIAYPDDPIQGGTANEKYPAWFRAATAAGLRVLISYDFSAELDDVHGYKGTITMRHLNYLLSGGMKPAKGGALLLNCERLTWQNSLWQKTCTAVNYGGDLTAVRSSLYPTFQLVGGIRTGRWFLETKDEGGVKVGSQLGSLDEANRVSSEVPWFFAEWVLNDKLVSGDFHALLASVPDPAITYKTAWVDGQQARVKEQDWFLYYGNYSKWNGWELATVRHAAVKDASGTPALFRLIMWNGNAEHFDQYFNFPAAGEPADPPVDPEEPPVKPEDPPASEVDLQPVIDKLEAQETLLQQQEQLLEQILDTVTKISKHFAP